MNDRIWTDLLEELRALGGRAENICLREGTLGRGLFPIDPAKPVHLHVPRRLLVAADDMVFEKGTFRVGPHARISDRERAFLDLYQRELAWGAEGRSDIERTFILAQALSADMRHDLSGKYNCGPWFDDMTEALVQEQFLAARCISFEGRTTVMPFIELANHGRGTDYAFADGLALKGTFADEILVSYSPFDPYEFFRIWGFVAEQPAALSIDLAGVGPSRVHVGRSVEATKEIQRAWLPQVRMEDDEPHFDFLLIGNRQYPRLPKGIFYKLMRDAGFSSLEESFDLIRLANQKYFLDMLEALDGIDLPIGRMLRKMAQNQLRAIAFCYGVRPI